MTNPIVPCGGASTTPDHPDLFPALGVVLAIPMTMCEACSHSFLESQTYPVLGIGRCCNTCIELMRSADVDG